MFPALSTSLKATIIQSCFHTITPRDAQTCQRSHLNFSHSYSSPYTGLQVHSWCIYLSPPIWVSSKTSHRPRTSSDRALTLVWMEPPQACVERRSTLTKGDKQDKFAQRAPALQRWSGLLAHAKPAHRPLRKKILLLPLPSHASRQVTTSKIILDSKIRWCCFWVLTHRL